MEKFKTLNNRVCKDIIRNACIGSHRAVYMLIYNHYDLFSDQLLERIFKIVSELCPILDVYSSLPFIVQTFYNQKWLTNELKF